MTEENLRGDSLIPMIVLARLTGKDQGLLSDYSIVAALRGHEVLSYQHLGSYQGTWLMLSKYGDRLFLWEDYYGSCSGCDSLEGANLSWDNADGIIEFVSGYHPFAELGIETATSLVEQNDLESVMPANIRDSIKDEEEYPKLIEDWKYQIARLKRT